MSRDSYDDYLAAEVERRYTPCEIHEDETSYLCRKCEDERMDYEQERAMEAYYERGE